jgi:hypothetical protein
VLKSGTATGLIPKTKSPAIRLVAGPEYVAPAGNLYRVNCKLAPAGAVVLAAAVPKVLLRFPRWRSRTAPATMGGLRQIVAGSAAPMAVGGATSPSHSLGTRGQECVAGFCVHWIQTHTRRPRARI